MNVSLTSPTICLEGSIHVGFVGQVDIATGKGKLRVAGEGEAVVVPSLKVEIFEQDCCTVLNV